MLPNCFLINKGSEYKWNYLVVEINYESILFHSLFGGYSQQNHIYSHKLQSLSPIFKSFALLFWEINKAMCRKIFTKNMRLFPDIA